MITPQLTEQYGQVLRVSVVRSIFRPWVCAYTGARLKPKTLTPAPPIKPVLMKDLREISIGHTSTSGLGLRGTFRRGYSARLGPTTTKVNAKICKEMFSRKDAKTQRKL